jgi:uracil-DNA glycosylase family 4
MSVSNPRSTALQAIERDVVACEKCPRLRAWCRAVAEEKRSSFRDWDYWGRPIPGWGDPGARILLVGLAPAAHGGNRTGRIFTGDRSGDFLFASLHRCGLANQPTSTHRDDGLRLRDVYIAPVVRCAPPANKPTPEELDTCRPYLERELAALKQLRVAVTLGRIGHEGLVRALKQAGRLDAKARVEFAHGAVHPLPAPLPTIVCSYHVSQQNTFTGTLTEAMFDDVIRTALALADRS